MSRVTWSAVLALALALGGFVAVVGAHESITAGDYIIEYGWLNEPPVAGQPNGVVLTIFHADEQAPAAETDSSPGTVPAGITFVEPTDGAAVPAGDLAVEVAFSEPPASNVHWHLYVDDRLASMIPASTTHYTVPGLTAGPHTLRAELAGADHGEAGGASVTIIVEGAGGQAALDTVPGVEAGGTIDVTGLTAEIVYGAEARVLALQPLAGGAPGQFIGRLTPSRPGQYTLRLGGLIGETPVSAAVQPEEVGLTDTYSFPAAASSSEVDNEAQAAVTRANAALTVAVVAGILAVAAAAASAWLAVRRR